MSKKEFDIIKLEIQNLKKQVEEQTSILQIQIQRIWKLEKELQGLSSIPKDKENIEVQTEVPVISPLPDVCAIDATSDAPETLSGELHETASFPTDSINKPESIQSFSQEGNNTSEAVTDKMTDLETEIGGNWLSKIGIAALFIGLTLFFKYAFEMGWINEVVRVALGGLAGLVLLSLGEYFNQQKKYLNYAHVLTGGGLAILYLSFYAAYGFYHLIPRSLAWVFLTGTTVSGVFFAMRYKHEAIGVIGFLGSYLTPFFLKAPSDPYLSYLSYGFVITLGAVWVSHHENWAIVQNLAVIGGLAIGAGVTSLYHFTAESLPDITLLLYGFGITLVSVVSCARKNWNTYALISFLGAILYVLLLGWSFEPPSKAIGFMNLMSYCAGLLVLGYIVADWKKWAECSFMGSLAGFLLPLGILPAGNYFSVLAPYWVGFILLAGLLYYRQGWMVPYGIALFSTHLVGIYWLIHHYTPGQFIMAWGYLSVWAALFLISGSARAWWREQFSSPRLSLLMASNVILYYAESYYLLNGKFDKGPGWFALGLVFIFLAVGWVGSRINKESKLYNETLLGLAGVFAVTAVPLLLNHHWIPIAWSAEAVLLNWLGLRHESSLLRRSSVVLLGFVVIRLFTGEYSDSLKPEWLYIPLVNSRSVAFIAAAITAFIMEGFRRKKQEILSPLEKKEIAGLLVLSGNFLLLFNFSVELLDFINTYYGRMGTFPRWDTELWMLKQASLSCLWAVYSVVLIGIGMAKRVAFLRQLGLLLFALTILKVFFFDLSSLERLYRIISFIALGIILLGVSYLYNRFRENVLKILKD